MLIYLFCQFGTGCATVFGGKVDDCQRAKPKDGEPTRRVRVGAMIADIVLFPLGLVVDFASNAMYKPCGSQIDSQLIACKFLKPLINSGVFS